MASGIGHLSVLPVSVAVVEEVTAVACSDLPVSVLEERWQALEASASNTIHTEGLNEELMK